MQASCIDSAASCFKLLLLLASLSASFSFSIAEVASAFAKAIACWNLDTLEFTKLCGAFVLEPHLIGTKSSKTLLMRTPFAEAGPFLLVAFFITANAFVLGSAGLGV